MCSGPHKRTTLTTGGKQDKQKPKLNRKPRFFLQNLPKPTDSKIFETVTTLHNKSISQRFSTEIWVSQFPVSLLPHFSTEKIVTGFKRQVPFPATKEQCQRKNIMTNNERFVLMDCKTHMYHNCAQVTRFSKLMDVWYDTSVCERESICTSTEHYQLQTDVTKQRTVTSVARLSHVCSSAVTRPHCITICNANTHQCITPTVSITRNKITFSCH